MKISVKIIPNAKKDECCGIENNVYKFKIKASPIEGKANIALCHFIATQLRCPKSAVNILKGHTAKMKILELPDDSNVEIFAKKII